MKKFGFIASVAIAVAAALTSCGKEGNGPVTSIVEDGFYVVGEATPIVNLQAEGAADATMAPGFDENTNALRDGMYEKYIYLEGGKSFQLTLKQGVDEITYGATLAKQTLDGSNDQIKGDIYRGVMSENTTMQVEETGLYHIILDLNEKGDLADKLIIVVPVRWGVSGAMNGWGFTEGVIKSQSATHIEYVWEDQEISLGGEFKFKYNDGWKVQLNELEDGAAADDTRWVKANTNLGKDCVPGGDNIAVADGAGTYTVSLVYDLKAGAIKNSYSYKTDLTAASDLPTEMYMTGTVCNWDWSAARAMTPVIGHNGEFFTITYLADTAAIKFNSVRDWNGSQFASLPTMNGCKVESDNCVVDGGAAGLYMIYVDMKNGVLTVEPAAVYGIGDSFGHWDGADEFKSPFSVSEDGHLMSVTTTAAGELRMFAHCSKSDALWWNMEFMIYDGQIVFRVKDDQERVPVTAGAVVTLDWENFTGTIE